MLENIMNELFDKDMMGDKLFIELSKYKKYNSCMWLDDLHIFFNYIIKDGNTVAHINEKAANILKEKWCIDDLFEYAVENIKRAEFTFTPMENLLSMIVPEEMIEVNEDMPLYVLSSKDSLYGAYQLFNPTALNHAYKILGPYYILPSSVHELICLNDIPRLNVETLREMVRDVNANNVEEKDQLSDDVFFYDGKGVVRK